MRSRYTAYVNIVNDYLLKTWHPSTRPVTLESALDSKTKWLGLKILDVLDGGVQDVTGEVEFVARYKVQGRAVRLHEHSRFIRERGCWYYLDGQAD
jgi:SEC-C motif-containing protein